VIDSTVAINEIARRSICEEPQTRGSIARQRRQGSQTRQRLKASASDSVPAREDEHNSGAAPFSIALPEAALARDFAAELLLVGLDGLGELEVDVIGTDDTRGTGVGGLVESPAF